MQAMVVQNRKKLHSLQVHKRLFKMIQIDMAVTFKNIIMLIFE
jgi:hypothetical protein